MKENKFVVSAKNVREERSHPSLVSKTMKRVGRERKEESHLNQRRCPNPAVMMMAREDAKNPKEVAKAREVAKVREVAKTKEAIKTREASIQPYCVAGFTGGAAVCAVYEVAGGGLPPGAPNLIDEACQATSDLADFVEDLFFPETVTISAEARFPSSGNFVLGSPSFRPEEDGSLGPSINLEGPEIPEVTSFTLLPGNPVAGQGYLASAIIICARPDTTAIISIEGTDGYTDSITCFGPQIQSSGGCSLSVPGAKQGVVDTVTARVNDPTTGETFEVAGLFFR